MQTPLDRFGLAVRDARDKRRWSQQELAQRLNMNKNTIMEIELGRSNPKGETIFLIAAELHISLDAVLYTETAMPNAVTADVLEFFSGKTPAESAEYIRFCQQIKALRKTEKSE